MLNSKFFVRSGGLYGGSIVLTGGQYGYRKYKVKLELRKEQEMKNLEKEEMKKPEWIKVPKVFILCGPS